MSKDRVGATSRYAGLARLEIRKADGTPVPYLARRFPPRSQGAVLGEHPVEEGDRPDTIAARHLGDPEQFWRLCDANGDLHPGDLTGEVGRRLRIHLPGGAGVSHD